MATFSILQHDDERRGYTTDRPDILFDGRTYRYTEDTGTTFEVVYPLHPIDTVDSDARTLLVSSVCDGHAGFGASYTVNNRIPLLFPSCIDEAHGDVASALRRLFATLGEETATLTSGTTCNVTVFDPANEEVHVASLGDSPTLRYRIGASGRFELVWKSDDQDCGDPEEVARMVDVHRRHGDPDADASTVVFQVVSSGHPTGIWRNKISQCMVHSSFGDAQHNYLPGIVNTLPRIYTQRWSATQHSDVWIQCTDGLLERLTHSKLGIQPQSEERLAEIARHLDVCHQHVNVAYSLHEMQIDAMFADKRAAHPLRSDNSRAWVESTFDNHLTKVFRWDV